MCNSLLTPAHADNRIAAARTDLTLAAEQDREAMRHRMKLLEGDMQTTASDNLDITAEMTRQYKAMQESLQGRIRELESEVGRLQGEVATSKQREEQARQDGIATVALKDAEIERLRERMEDMASEFGDMLAETIRKMADRIEIAPEGYPMAGSSGGAGAAASGGDSNPGAADAGASGSASLSAAHVPMLKKMEEISAGTLPVR